MNHELLLLSQGKFLEGPILLTPNLYEDSRGFFFESWNLRHWEQILTSYGQEMTPEMVITLVNELGRIPKQRTTLYEIPPTERKKAGFNVADLEPEITTLAERYKRSNKKQEELVRPGLRV